LLPLDGLALAGALEVTRGVYPFACFLLAGALLMVLWADSWGWVNRLRSTYVVAALGALVVFAYLSPLVPWYMNLLDEMAQATRTESTKHKPANNTLEATPPSGGAP